MLCAQVGDLNKAEFRGGHARPCQVSAEGGNRYRGGKVTVIGKDASVEEK